LRSSSASPVQWQLHHPTLFQYMYIYICVYIYTHIYIYETTNTHNINQVKGVEFERIRAGSIRSPRAGAVARPRYLFCHRSKSWDDATDSTASGSLPNDGMCVRPCMCMFCGFVRGSVQGAPRRFYVMECRYVKPSGNVCSFPGFQWCFKSAHFMVLICIHTHIYIYIYIYNSLYIHTSMYFYIFISVHLYIYIYLY
jgi:hypothetical protein